ncbi:MAG TPA: hypothetical protein VEZ20_06730 [Allosphingosinicella sp.]|jgi:hypothetical protein|nr:hypothetical protein [Allosphingosinicella sp.]
MRTAGLLVVSLAGGCSFGRLPDQITAEAASPDGTLVARSWCEDGCDITHRRTITIAPAGVAADRQEMPSDHVAGRIYLAEVDGAELRMNWTGNRSLRLAGECLADDRGRLPAPWSAGGVRVEPARRISPRPCPQAR